MSNVTRLVKPVLFTPDMLASSTVPNADADWTAGTYADGVRRTYTVTATKGFMKGLPMVRVFESLVAGNTAVPGTDPTKWLDVGPANRYAMFDTKVSTQATVADNMLFEVIPDEIVTTVALLNVLGVTAKLEIIEDDVVTYTNTVDLLTEGVDDWFEYFTNPFEQLEKVLFLGVPAYASSRMLVTITGSETALGHMVFGRTYDIGYSPELGASSGIIDYSRKETDEFGETEFVERAYADQNSIVVRVDKARLNAVKRLLTKQRATPCLLLGSDEEAYAETLINFGWIKEHRVVVAYHVAGMIDIDFEGLI